jgi:hypothetical protein
MNEHRFLESDWDYAIVLDACRYDAFSRLYEEYLTGSLEKRKSPGSSTPEWAYRTFTGEHDIAYFSGNPFINSLGIPLNELKWGASCEYEWTATEHLGTVVDVWKDGWDESLGTVPPDSLARSMRAHQSVVADHDRTVLHYMQPHAPYLGRGDGRKLTKIRDGIKRQGDQAQTQVQTQTQEPIAADTATAGASTGGDTNTNTNTDTDARTNTGARTGGVLSAVGDRVRPAVESVLEDSSLAMKAGLFLELDTAEALRQGTRETALAYHEANLRIALESVAEIAEELDGQVVVTADHGEAFGEQGVWEHHIETHIPPLVEVPWLELAS